MVHCHCTSTLSLYWLFPLFKHVLCLENPSSITMHNSTSQFFPLGSQLLPILNVRESQQLPCSTCLQTNFAVFSCALDSFTVSLHSPNSRHLPAVRATQGDCQWPLKNVGNSHRSHEPRIHCNWGIPNLYLDQLITKGCQLIWDYVSYPTECSTAIWMGLCISLYLPAMW